MALLGSLATGASGVKTQGKSMQVIGNNIANVNTFGFKRNNVAFEDLMGNQYPQGGSFTQVSNGVKIGSVEMEFSQGAFETTALATDMAIGGGGFFTVIDPATGAEAYTRNGQFSYDVEGFLSTARGMRVQALEVDRNTGESKGLAWFLESAGIGRSAKCFWKWCEWNRCPGCSKPGCKCKCQRCAGRSDQHA